ncbi:MAG: class I SAM-dependent methyltransferase [Ilumatobacter sp.]|nr:class I SAM-dependent methyltransferase [Ilumatobacter sp.]
MKDPSETLRAGLSDATEWRVWLWAPVVRRLIGDPEQWAGRRVLELGPRRGAMSMLFAELGATVHGLDIDGEHFDVARAAAERRGVSDRVTFSTYDGSAGMLPDGPFDVIFCKSVLVVVPDLEQFLVALRDRLVEGGQFLAAENAASGKLMTQVRGRIIHRSWDFDVFHGADDAFVETFRRVFSAVETFRRLGLVVGLRATT